MSSKDDIPKELTSGTVYKFQCRLCNECCYGECLRYLKIGIVEDMRISRMTKKKVKVTIKPLKLIFSWDLFF